MPSFCVVDQCCDKYGHSESISFHKFPFKRKDLLEAWIDFAHRGPSWKPTKWSAICSQHFTPGDFNCANSRKLLKRTAVPTVRVLKQKQAATQVSPMKAKSGQSNKIASVEQMSETDGDVEEEIAADETPPQNVAVPGQKINCRLCGTSANSACTFSSNFEIFGMIQKCFPTLNIQQDDNLPKDMCNVCLKRLQSFSEFIDKVFETQRELQQKFRPEKLTKQSLEPRSLKIKQEPIVKVKQEVAEGLESFIADDLDAAMDESCEPENDTASVDQKFGFCDFPMLNAQDIINNCDIMEIINLDDPFINIPDDDAATINATVQLDKNYLPSAHQLLQTHMLIDEHNYACPAEDLKEEWQIKKCCKTEEADAVENALYDQLEAVEANNDDEFQPSGQFDATNVEENVMSADVALKSSAVERSARPIVTSVSAIPESRLHLHNSKSLETETNKNNNTNNNKIVVTSISDMLPVPNHTHASVSSALQKENVVSSKPNIVVLNESIVKSTEAFQLHACAVCQLKFFSIESLQQHVSLMHMRGNDVVNGARAPMVSLPLENLPQSNDNRAIAKRFNNNQDDSQEKTTKLDDNKQLLNTNEPNHADVDTSNALNQQLRNLQSWQHNMKTLQLNALINNWNNRQTVNGYHNGSGDLQQDQQLPAASEVHQAAQEKSAAQQIEEIKLQLKADEAVFKRPQTTSKRRNGTRSFPRRGKIRKHRKTSAQLNQVAGKKPMKECIKLTKVPVRTSSQKIDYKTLQMRYTQLLRKCKKLQENCQLLIKSEQNSCVSLSACVTASNRRTHQCTKCNKNFCTIRQLLQHKLAIHRPAKKYSVFSATCHGCEKYFLSKVALRNHMKYICQSLSLRLLKTQLQIFKCRHCRSISFTHWRLCRNHEINCKRKMKQQQLRKVHKCTECDKQFVHVQMFAQHLQVEHHARWNLKCLHCTRIFKCLSMLMDHHTKLSCRVNPSSDCAVLCCKCRQYFQHYNQLLMHRNCSKQKGLQSKSLDKSPRIVKPAEFACNQCPKVFTSSNNLSQHRITHTQGRHHKCGLCHRAFKRRGGLTQHMKSFHLQLKPYECPVCKYRFALKCDMQRCKHSTLQQKRYVEGPVSAVEE